MTSVFKTSAFLFSFFVAFVCSKSSVVFVDASTSTDRPVLSNFQGLHACKFKQKVAMPKTEEELRLVIAEVKGSDERNVKMRAVSSNAHSWNELFWCARGSADESDLSVNVFMNELRSRAFDIHMSGKFVTVDAGMKTRDVLSKLAAEGWTLKSVPWFIDQTIGGAVSTCTHGSSLKFGSISQQLLAIRVMLSNATIATITREEYGDTIFDAFRCNVGQLGITLAVTLEVIKESSAQRINEEVSSDKMLREIEAASDIITKCKANVKDEDEDWFNSCAMKSKEVQKLDDSSYFYFVPTSDSRRVQIRRNEEFSNELTDDERKARSAILLKTIKGRNDDDSNVPRNLNEFLFQVTPSKSTSSVNDPDTTRNRFMQNDRLSITWTNLWKNALENSIESVTSTNASKAYLTMTERQLDRNDNFPMEQNEVSIDLADAGRCLRYFMESIERPNFYRSPILIRFLSAESALLSPSNGRASMYVNIENFKTSQEGIKAYDDAIKLLVSSSQCNGRLHFGKFGWLDGLENGYYSIYEKYGNAYCKFLKVRDMFEESRMFQTDAMRKVSELKNHCA